MDRGKRKVDSHERHALHGEVLPAPLCDWGNCESQPTKMRFDVIFGWLLVCEPCSALPIDSEMVKCSDCDEPHHPRDLETMERFHIALERSENADTQLYTTLTESWHPSDALDVLTSTLALLLTVHRLDFIEFSRTLYLAMQCVKQGQFDAAPYKH